MARLALPSYAEALVEGVLARTGYPIAVAEDPALEMDSLLRIARPEQPFHELVYRSEYAEFATHFVVNNARKVLRLYAAEPGDRFVAATPAEQRLPFADEYNLRFKIPPIEREDFAKLSRYLRFGIARQLTSTPVDLRVEMELYDELAEHRELQRRYFARQVRDLELLLDPMIECLNPRRIYQASMTMHVALAREFSERAGVQPGPRLRAALVRVQEEPLRDALRRGTGHAGDRAATDAWADELGLMGWYEWVPYRVPSDAGPPSRTN